MIRVILFLNDALFLYYLCSNLIYLLLLIFAIRASIVHLRQLASIRLERFKASPFSPPISIIAPAHNEGQSIAQSVKSFLSLDYPAIEVIIVNDGSVDDTLEVLTREFNLLRTDLLYVQEVPCQPVRGVYMSQTEARLLVVDKEAGGSKADASNAGLNVASSPYVCILDADSLLERDSLLRVMVPILADPAHVVAAGGIVRAVNGSVIEGGRVQKVRLPKHFVEIVQVVEYLRAFLVGREGWGYFNMLMIISGAFGVFRRDLVREVGGYRPKAIGEDFDLVVRMHRRLREKGVHYRMCFVPDPVCWTEVPPDWSSLGKQRSRWQKGMIDTLWPNRDMLFRPRYGRIGWVALPNLWLYEALAPVVELLGLASIVTAALLGILSHRYFVMFLIFGYAFATMLSIGGVLLEEITYRRYGDWREVAKLLFCCLAEHFPYRQIHLWWRLRGMWEYARGDVAWGKMTRVGFGGSTSPGSEVLTGAGEKTTAG
jgi:cellulose synthase/poly-beta-1,6-N-acetylglucosamine synthase-like glycosyltransferase